VDARLMGWFIAFVVVTFVLECVIFDREDD
jgi:hypothetical protein